MNKEIDLLLYNGNIITMNSKNPNVEAVAIKNGKIMDIGKSKDLVGKYQYREKIDLKKKFACPGFNDTHTHLLAISAKFQDVMLDKVKSPTEALELIKIRVEKSEKGKWIFGERWDESNWEEKRYLTLEELDKIAPENPCYIRRVCGHLVAVNSLALKELEIDFDDSDLDLDPKTKKPIGIITDALIDRIATNPKLKKTQQDLNNAVKVACNYAHSLGVTSVTDNSSVRGFKAYLNAWKNDELNLRVYVNIPRLQFEHYLNAGLVTGFGDTRLQIGGVKIFTDGSLGARTAALKEPYFDDKTTTGGFYIDKKVFFDTIKKAVENGWQTANHAIGDEALDWVLEAFEQFKESKIIKNGRHRIEHAEYLLDEQIERVKKLGLILSMQPNFPGRWGQPGQLYEARLGPKRFKKLNNFRKLVDEKMKISFGSDNMPMSPIFGIYSVTSHPLEEIRITAEEALYYFTLGAAYSSFEEDIKGSIEINKLADIVVLDKDLLKVNPEEIKDIKVLATIFDGKVVYNELN